MIKKIQADYLTVINPLKALVVFCIPMIIGNFFQQMYTIIDAAIVGRYVSGVALAAIGASYSLTNIFICIAIGGGMGASVVVSQYFGSLQYKKMKSAIFTAIISFFIIGILLGILGIFSGSSILKLLNTPKDCFDMAIDYLNIYFYGLPFLFLYNILSAMFNALGKSKIPLYFLIFSSISNVVLDLLLVIKFKMGITGVAWATLIAQGISAFMSLVVLIKILKNYCENNFIYFDNKELKSMTKIALPSIFQQSTVSIGMMLVQSVVNSFGADVLAGFSVAMRVESLCIVPMLAIGNAVSSYTAQNIGANKKERVEKGYIESYKLVILFSIIIFFLIQIFYKDIIISFLGENSNDIIFNTAKRYLRFVSFFFCFIGFKMSVDGLLRGSGDMIVFTLANLANLTIRVCISMIFAPVYRVQMIWVAVPMGWFVNWIISFLEYKSGRWKYIKI